MYLIPQDKANHFIYGLVVGLTALVLCRALGYPHIAVFTCPLCSAMIGLMKEVCDRQVNKKAERVVNNVEVWDAVSTTLGGVVISLVIVLQGAKL